MNRAWRIAPALACLAAAGCSSAGSGAYGDYMGVLRQSWQGRSGNITLQQAAAIPYASFGFRLNGSNQQILVLATDTASEQLWTAASHIVFLTRDGRVRRTVGLPHNLGGTTSALIPAPGLALKGRISFALEMDFPDSQLFGVHLNCQAAPRSAAAITILGKVIRAVRIDEACIAANREWTFTNSYWVDAENGFVWKSRQTIHPKGDVVEIEIFRPPG